MEKYVFLVEPKGAKKDNTEFASLNFDWTEEEDKYKVFVSEKEAGKRALQVNGQVVQYKLTGRKVITVELTEKETENYKKKVARIEKAKEDAALAAATEGLVDTPKIPVKRRKKRKTTTRKKAA